MNAGTSPATGAASKARCFVVMGFGIKTDLATGRKLDLDKSYRLLIKPTVEAANLECIRADEIRHSGTIDVPMYRELLGADFVIADLSTANPNALYELGIRHALRPRTTIVISENKLPYPFDLNHILIQGYAHLGDAIDYDEVIRFRKVLGEQLEAVIRSSETDSPVYTFLPKLTPPFEPTVGAREKVQSTFDAMGKSLEAAVAGEVAERPKSRDQTLSVLIQQGENAIERDDFAAAKALFKAALKSGQAESGKEGAIAHDSYLIQRLALATYKAKQPTHVTALEQAMAVLQPLRPDDSNDPETVGLAGAIAKRLFDEGQGVDHLSRAIGFYGRGYYLRNDWYNAINLAYLLNVRADSALDAKDTERIADLVWANRIRREVVALCNRDLAEIVEREERLKNRAEVLESELRARNRERKFWCLATLAEAHFGLGAFEEYRKARETAVALGEACPMTESMDKQISYLKHLLSRHGPLLDPPWHAPT
jgi:hypothetical protein